MARGQTIFPPTRRKIFKVQCSKQSDAHNVKEGDRDEDGDDTAATVDKEFLVAWRTPSLHSYQPFPIPFVVCIESVGSVMLFVMVSLVVCVCG